MRIAVRTKFDPSRLRAAAVLAIRARPALRAAARDEVGAAKQPSQAPARGRKLATASVPRVFDDDAGAEDRFREEPDKRGDFAADATIEEI